MHGLVSNVRRGSPQDKYFSCYALAQLAWSHKPNSELIPSVCCLPHLSQPLGRCIPCRHLATDASTNLQTPGALDALAGVLSDGSLENVRAREYAVISIGNCGANSKGAALTMVKHQALAQGLLLCLTDDREKNRSRSSVRLQEVTIIALKNCAASSEEAGFIIAQNSTTLVLLKDLAVQDVSARSRDVVSYLHLQEGQGGR